MVQHDLPARAATKSDLVTHPRNEWTFGRDSKFISLRLQSVANFQDLAKSAGEANDNAPPVRMHGGHRDPVAGWRADSANGSASDRPYTKDYRTVWTQFGAVVLNSWRFRKLQPP